MSKDLYAILGVEKSATSQQIKEAYRNKAKRLHPDINKSIGAEDDFQSLNEAYMTLSDPKKRKVYDDGGQPEIKTTFTQEEVEELLRRAEEERRYRWFGHQPRNRYPPTDYPANEKGARWINLAMMLVAFTFILDFFVYLDYGITRVEKTALALKFDTRNSAEEWLSIQTGLLNFEQPRSNVSPRVGDELEIRKSLIYGHYKWRKVGNIPYRYTAAIPTITYILAIFVLLAGGLGVSPIINPEQRFNAAIVSCFFCLILLGTLVLI